MLTLSDVSKSYAGRTLFSGASLQVNRGDRIGLVGPNGAGKSTLFSLILGDATPDEGQISWEKNVARGYLPQEVMPVGQETVLAMAMQLAGEHDWEIEPKAKTILRGLAFRESDFQRPANTLSGGWIMRAHLARLLVQEPEMLLLDEPTNHLDLESLVWFQDYLKYRYPGAILMISHDREFLNQIIGGIVELSRQRLLRYRGNYEEYLREKQAREAQHEAAYQNQQREIARLQAFADRFRAKASKASQAQSKLKQIERMEKIDAPLTAEKSVRFRFPQPKKSGQRVVTLSDVDFAYPNGSRVYHGLNFEAERGQRVVLVGPNGAGKSTLLKLLAGTLEPERGERKLGFHVQVGYFTQHRGEMLDGRKTVLEEANSVENRPPEQVVRTLLGAFLFRGDDVFKPVGVLSGGEKTRLALAKMLLDPPNLLLMDEPTTHLDMGSIDALVNALADYEGTLIFISHDVYFIRAIAREVLHISAGQLTPYAGDYQYYLDRTQATSERAALTAGQKLADARPEPAPDQAAKSAVKTYKTKEEKRAEAQAREAEARAKREWKQRIAELESRIAEREARQKELVAQLEDPETYKDGGKAVALNRELLAAQEDLERLTAEWEAAAEIA